MLLSKFFLDLMFLFSAKKAFHKIARSPEEKNRIYQFRYQIYQEELAFDDPHINHELKIIKDDADDDERCTLLFLEENDQIIATVRVFYYPKGQMPQERQVYYDLQHYSWMQNHTICELGRFVCVKKFRKKSIILKLIISMMKYCVSTKMEIVLMHCKPYMIPYYIAFGWRPYTAHLIDHGNGVGVPLIAFLDKTYAEKINSPARFIISDKKVIDLDLIKDIYNKPTSIILEKKAILHQIKQVSHESRMMPLQLFEALINAKCYLLIINEPIKLIHKGMVEKAIYYILTGKAIVKTETGSSYTIGPHQLIGETSFFTTDGKRMADVILQERTEVFVIKESAINSLKKKQKYNYILLLEFIMNNLIQKNYI